MEVRTRPLAVAVQTAGVSGEPLGERIRRLRMERALSLRGLAVRLGCCHSLVVRWEQGVREPSVADLGRLAAALGTTPDALLDGAALGCGRVASSRAHGPSGRQERGRRLRRIRARREASTWDVWTATGIDGRRLRAIESGADPSLAELDALTRMFGVTVAHLLATT